MNALICLSSHVMIVAGGGALQILRPDHHDTTEAGETAGPLLRACLRPQPLATLRAEHDPLLLDRMLDEGVLVAWGDHAVSGLHASTLHGPDRLDLAHPPEPLVDDARLLREYSGADPITLPEAGLVSSGLMDALHHRRSARRFPGTTLPIALLATLLSAALGVDSSRQALPRSTGGPPARPAYPSPGALYPVEVALLTWNVDGIAPGAYRYQPFSNRLVHVGTVSPQDAWELLPEHPAEEAAALVILWVDLRSTIIAKYGAKGYRLALLEAGHVMQNLVLVGTALELPSLPVAGFRDADLARRIGLVSTEQVPVYALLVGDRA